jgi:hypothetical protein
LNLHTFKIELKKPLKSEKELQLLKNFFQRLTADSVLGTEGESGGWQRGGCHLFLDMSLLLDRLSSSKLVSSLNCLSP